MRHVEMRAGSRALEDRHAPRWRSGGWRRGRDRDWAPAVRIRLEHRQVKNLPPHGKAKLKTCPHGGTASESGREGKATHIPSLALRAWMVARQSAHDSITAAESLPSCLGRFHPGSTKGGADRRQSKSSRCEPPRRHTRERPPPPWGPRSGSRRLEQDQPLLAIRRRALLTALASALACRSSTR